VAGSCRPTSTHLAAELGVEPIVPFDFNPAPLARQFDVVLDTVGSLPITTALRLIRPAGRIIDIVPTPRKLLRSMLPGPYSAFMGRASGADLHEIAEAVEQGDVHLPIAWTVPLTAAIAAFTELEKSPTSKGGKLVITIP